MITNQTIDGVLRELEKAMSFYFGAKEVRNFKLYLRREFKPARSKTTARTIELSLGQVERAYDTAMVSGNRDLADELRGLLKAESAHCAESQVEPSAQPQGEPVAWQRKSKNEEERWFHLPDSDVEEAIRLGYEVRKLYAEQPAPVAVVPDRDSLRDIIAQAIGGDTYDCVRVWSSWSFGTMSEDDFVPVVEQEARLYEIADACLGELKRLPPSL